MSTRDNLSQLSEEELEKLYQEKKAEYDQKMSKNRRIRGILLRKINEKQESVNNLKKEIDDIIFYQSILSREGPEYRIIKKFSLPPADTA